MELAAQAKIARKAHWGYALKSKKTRDQIMKTLCDEVERSSDRLIEDAKPKAKGSNGKKLGGYQKDVKLVEVDD